MLSLAPFGLGLLFAIVLCVHVVRTNQPMYWLWIILAFPGIGGLIYIVTVILPDLAGGRTARRMGATALDTLAPERAYRQAKAAHDDTPTVANAIRLAGAAADLGRHAEAERLYADAAQGIHAEDPTLLLGRANALIELGRAADALPLLDQLQTLSDKGVRTPQEALARGRACEALGRHADAQEAYEFAAGRLPGLEAIARYAAFLARSGKKAEAADQLTEIDRRIKRADPYFRKEARAWRELAARAIG
ncbi:hypothetical protein [Phenylobacterium montanum]|uniref:Tetratricopeptide repeat protein n=1 Tax=Phenylobacterium montanum TaxID=2823693 RepID=A0A975FXF8_9CAUL|nr:hypothetical protein [Caulobacter sp. S6]QUD87253.1 hypothetical protein KCG34_19700 [Caulobacter sp. S6]